MEINGSVQGIVFRNAENGYTVCAVDVHGLIITAVGIFPPITEGENVTLKGDYKLNSRYGEQFVVEEVIVSPPTDEYSMIKYLSSGLFRGVGEVTASAIVNKFKGDTFDVIQFNPIKLAEVRGISKNKAEEIGAKFAELRAMQRAIMFLGKFHVSLNLSLKIYRCYQQNTENIIKTNPYKLVGEVEGIGFKTADQIATSIGIKNDDPNRVKAGIRYCLDEVASRAGHTYLQLGRIITEVKKLLSFSEEQVELINQALEDLEISGDIVRINKKGTLGYMLDKYYFLESGIAKKIVKIITESRPLDLDFNRELDFFERSNGIKFHPSQREAIQDALNNGCVIITGGPGTGKTTIIKCIIYMLENMAKRYALTAPTGRAAKRMNEATGRNAMTMHRLLEMNKHGFGSCVYNDLNPLPYDVVIVDEVSMADEFIFYALLRALDRGSKLILVGDKDQLPSVGAGSVLADLIESELIPVRMLNHIYRQSEDSFIITNAHLINKGILPEPNRNSKDFFFDYQEDEKVIIEHTRDFVTKRISKYIDVKPDEIQILAPLKQGTAGVISLNSIMQSALNPPTKLKEELNVGSEVLRVGDRVIQTANNYDIEWYKDVGDRFVGGVGVFNGDIGIIDFINKGEGSVRVLFEDGRVATYSADELDQLSLAYAISVHKSQGSEFRVVILVLSRYNPMVLSKNLFYTAVTRAKEMVVVVGNRETVVKMTKNKYTEKRLTALVDFILEEVEKNT